jgi:hypothetical protein
MAFQADGQGLNCVGGRGMLGRMMGFCLTRHSEPRTTGLYDRRQKKVMRNIVERISI